jgi:hypothetical protein
MPRTVKIRRFISHIIVTAICWRHSRFRDLTWVFMQAALVREHSGSVKALDRSGSYQEIGLQE